MSAYIPKDLCGQLFESVHGTSACDEWHRDARTAARSQVGCHSSSV